MECLITVEFKYINICSAVYKLWLPRRRLSYYSFTITRGSLHLLHIAFPGGGQGIDLVDISSHGPTGLWSRMMSWDIWWLGYSTKTTHKLKGATAKNQHLTLNPSRLGTKTHLLQKTATSNNRINWSFAFMFYVAMQYLIMLEGIWSDSYPNL